MSVAQMPLLTRLAPPKDTSSMQPRNEKAKYVAIYFSQESIVCFVYAGVLFQMREVVHHEAVVVDDLQGPRTWLKVDPKLGQWVKRFERVARSIQYDKTEMTCCCFPKDLQKEEQDLGEKIKGAINFSIGKLV